jgi:hypothetical protein
MTATNIIAIARGNGDAAASQATAGTAHQATEQIVVRIIIAACHLLVLGQPSLGQIKSLLADDGRDRDRNPLFYGCRQFAEPWADGQQG